MVLWVRDGEWEAGAGGGREVKGGGGGGSEVRLEVLREGGSVMHCGVVTYVNLTASGPPFSATPA